MGCGAYFSDENRQHGGVRDVEDCHRMQHVRNRLHVLRLTVGRYIDTYNDR